MKLSIIFASLAPVAFIFAAVSAFAGAAPSVSHAPKALVEAAASTLTDCKMPAEACKIVRATTEDRETVYRLSEAVISASRPAAAVKAKRFACGTVESNLVGGSQRTCEWK